MPSIAYLTAALALTSAVAATPVQKRDAFSVEQVKHSVYLKNGPAQIAKALRRHGKAVPEHIQAAAEARAKVDTPAAAAAAAAATGAEAANPKDQYDESYLCPVTVGTTTLNLDFDTGSSDLWVFSSLQPASQLSGRRSYPVVPSKAKSGYTWSISYGDGSSAKGKVYTDKVTVAGVSAASQAVEAATTASGEFLSDKQTDGLLGLAFSSINTVSPVAQTTFFDTVKSSLAKPLFAANLKYHAAGVYDFGFIDSSKYTGPITYVPVDNSQGFWGFSASGYSIGGGSTVRSSISGIVDTGTTLMLVDQDIADDYYSQVDGASEDDNEGGYIFPCDATLPDFSIVVGGVLQTVPGQYINYSPTMDDPSTCLGGMQTNQGLGFSIFGDIFLKSKYVIHDLSTGSPRLGFAQQAGI